MLPSSDLNEYIDVRALSYVGPNPGEADSFRFSGPHGITLHLKLVMPHPDVTFSWNRDAVLYLPNLEPLWSQDSSRIGFKLAYKPLVRVTISERHLAALPSAPHARAAALIQNIAMFLDPEAPRFRNGSAGEMLVLLQAFASLTNVPLELMSAVNASDKVTLKSHGRHGWISCGYITPTLIVEWFSPISSLPNFFADVRADLRKPHRTVIKPQELTAHDRLEAISSIAAFLKARNAEGHLERSVVRAALSEIDIDDARIATPLETE